MSKISREFVIDANRSVAATGVTAAINVSQDDGYCFQTVFTGLAASASGTCTLQTSLNGVNFSDYPSSAQNFTNATDNLMWEVTTKRHEHVRLKFTANATGTGTCTTTFYSEAFTD